MIKHTWYSWNIKKQHINFLVKQIYARIYVKSQKKVVVVSKNNIKWQMPGWKPKNWENFNETLNREIYEETSLKLEWKNPILFWYYVVKEFDLEYLQLRYFVEISGIDENILVPCENWDADPILTVRLVNIDELSNFIPRLLDSWELKSFLEMLK